MGLSMKEKKAVTRETGREYQNAGKKEKDLILDHLVRLTGYNRKYAVDAVCQNRNDGRRRKNRGVQSGKKPGPENRRVNRSTPQKPSPA
ncbi:MAG: hypothetical protein LBP23_04620 [Treponema sp.]|nr:hypothetical protein [Treponema sp.]